MTELEAIAKLLFDKSDKSNYFEIHMNGKVISFNGVRVFKSKGSAKAAITNNIKHVLQYHFIDTRKNNMVFTYEDPRTVITYEQGNIYADDKIKVKSFLDELLDKKIIEIKEVKNK